MPHRKLIERLLAAGSLSESEKKALTNLPYIIKNLASGDIAVHRGHRAVSCTVVMTGILSRQRVVSDRNQISAVYVPGDIPDLNTLHMPLMDHDLCSTGPSTVAFVDHGAIRQLLRDFPGLTYAFWRETVFQARIYREWAENLGARQALSRVAHLLCEIAVRLEQVGLASEGKFRFPFTQADIANACGLSAVHINRIIQDLRRRRMIDWQGQAMQLVERQSLEMLAEFDRSYLHQDDAGPAPSQVRLPV